MQRKGLQATHFTIIFMCILQSELQKRLKPKEVKIKASKKLPKVKKTSSKKLISGDSGFSQFSGKQLTLKTVYPNGILSIFRAYMVALNALLCPIVVLNAHIALRFSEMKS